jgi:hypothetical protein
MREEARTELGAGSGVEDEAGESKRPGSDLDRRFPLALAMYALLAALVWFTMDSGKVEILGRPVELRLVPLIVLGGLALRTVLARQAERIRRQAEKDSY